MTKEILFWPSVSKCLTRDSDPNFEEYSNFALLFKQIIGLVLGLILGFFGVQGMLGFVGFLLVTIIFSVLYAKNFLGIDEEDIENYKIISEGLFAGFIVFLLTWIMTYTFIHFGN